MMLNVKCEYCGYGDLKGTDWTTIFYCPTCDEHYSLNELDIEEVKEQELSKVEFKRAYGYYIR